MPLGSLLLSWRGKRILVLVVLFVVTLFAGYRQRILHNPAGHLYPWNEPPPLSNPDNRPPAPRHPIDDLMQAGERSFNNVLQREVYDLRNAARTYRFRRKRHPPPGFEEWYAYAKKHGAVMIEDLFDQIYDDLEPFWGMPPDEIRDSSHGLDYRISIRNGALDKSEDKRYRVNFWHEMLKQIARFLPDLDLAFNHMDEPRLLVPWEDVDTFIAEAARTGKQDEAIWDWEEYLTDYPTYEMFDAKAKYEHNWSKQGPYWNLARESCPPDSNARHFDAVQDFSHPPTFPSTWPNGSYKGYVANWTIAKDPCSHPHLRSTHGTFIEPISLSTSKKLFPLFGGSKLPINNEILVPAPRYWTTEAKFTGHSFWSYFYTTNDWERKLDKVLWRGVASGGRSRDNSWTHYQRHRFLSMLNSSHVAADQAGFFPPENMPLPSPTRPYNTTAADAMGLPDWLSSITDAAFTDLECFPKKYGAHCPYTEPYYSIAPNMDMYKMYDYKYIPDIDGNSFSGRYRAFLLSSSLPIKATIYNEWHDSRLWAWQHFVPMDNTFVDFYGIMDYFLGHNGGVDASRAKRGHDEQARKIAMQGKEWAEKVLRREDMLIYMYRLMLEYARVCSDDRDRMGYVDDLLNPEKINKGST